MRRILLVLIITAASVTWGLERAKTTELQARIDALQPAERTSATLIAEQIELRHHRLSDTERQKLRTASAEAADLEKAIGTGKAPATNPIATSAVGEWSPVATWQNRGTTAPRDTIETALWAAAGGDIAQFAQLLELSAANRAQADALIARLPASAQAQFPNAEALIAAFTIKNIPVGPAQVVWSQQSDADDATLCVFIRNPNVAPAPIEIVPAHFADEPDPAPQMTREEAIAMANKKAEERKNAKSLPPTIAPNAHTTLAYLSLHRTDAGWRLVVPDSAISKISRELTSAPPAR